MQRHAKTHSCYFEVGDDFRPQTAAFDNPNLRQSATTVLAKTIFRLPSFNQLTARS